MLLIIYFGGLMFNIPFNLVTEPKFDLTTGAATNRLVIDSISFYVFFLMCMFNMINCRTDSHEVNMFANICNNWIFWVVFIIEMLIHHAIFLYLSNTKLGGSLAGCTPLYFWQ